MLQAIEAEVQSLLDNFTSLQVNGKQGARIKFNNHIDDTIFPANKKHKIAYPLALSSGDLHVRYAVSPRIALR
ncbi:hypothetical protein [Candidatus Enterovibrio escicola]|uniref:hypothetical protein n=1 Tax=Candidatus Enterovibrio escicola TaxID=1927127 RepID=UPI0016819752|nr:hypothetical protein [Candidatus Enterovibrio escacola]